jgi:hypothetical protein
MCAKTPPHDIFKKALATTMTSANSDASPAISGTIHDLDSGESDLWQLLGTSAVHIVMDLINALPGNSSVNTIHC